MPPTVPPMLATPERGPSFAKVAPCGGLLSHGSHENHLPWTHENTLTPDCQTGGRNHVAFRRQKSPIRLDRKSGS
jgi:hypothetical protein